MHPGVYGSVDVVECKGHHYTTPEENVVHNGLWREGEELERTGRKKEKRKGKGEKRRKSREGVWRKGGKSEGD